MGAVTRRSSLLSAQASQGPRRHRPDYWLLILTALLLAIGLVVVYAISPALIVEKNVNGSFYVMRQMTAVGLGIIVFGVTSFIPLERWKQLSVVLLAAAAAVTLIALLQPTNPDYPAHRWIRLGAGSFQSVELVKFALLVWVSALLSKIMAEGALKDNWQTFKPLIICLGVVAVVVAFVQSDFGSTAVITAMIAAMVFVAGVPMKRLLLIGAAVAIVGTLAISAVPYRRERITAFFHQSNTTQCSDLKTGYQACRALVAVGSGGMVGLGLGNSVQAYGYLPEAENDSIFAIYAEKFGFIGVSVLLGLFLAFFSRIKRIMELAPDNFTRLIATGVFAWLATQTFINVGAMLGLLPLKGITLPFISYGGTSVLFVMAATGLLFNISRYTLFSIPRQSDVSNGRTGYESSSDRRRVRGAYHPGTGSRT